MTTATADDTQEATGGNTMASSSPGGVDFVFQCAVVSIGVVGAAANALILYAMVTSKHHAKQLLIFNQNVFDFCGCIFLIVVYSLKISHIYLTGTFGYWLCMMLLSENLLWVSLNGSAVNLLSVTIERYLKVVHPVLGKKLLRKSVIYSGIAFAWIGSIIYTIFHFNYLLQASRARTEIAYILRTQETQNKVYFR